MIKTNFNHKKGIIYIAGILVLFSLVLYFFRNTSLFSIITKPFELYLRWEIKFVVSLHQLFGSGINTDGFLVSLSGLPSIPFESKYLMKKWLVIIILFFIISPTTIKNKIRATLTFIPFHFLVIAFKISNIILLYQLGFTVLDAESISQSISILLFLLIIFYWLSKNPKILSQIAIFTKTRHIYILKKFKVLKRLLYGFIFVQLILGIFQFEPWINFIFTTTHHLLDFMGYNSIVEPFYLLGENGNIYMAKGCLGIKTTYIFASFIFLTGESLKKISFFAAIGIVVVNVSNILRFVFLFIHLQNHGEYLWNMEVHDLFNIMIYSIIFIMWIIWLEWFTDIWPYLKLSKEEKAELQKRKHIHEAMD
jgi:exosortase/archaeosortase family protein